MGSFVSSLIPPFRLARDIISLEKDRKKKKRTVPILTMQILLHVRSTTCQIAFSDHDEVGETLLSLTLCWRNGIGLETNEKFSSAHPRLPAAGLLLLSFRAHRGRIPP